MLPAAPLSLAYARGRKAEENDPELRYTAVGLQDNGAAGSASSFDTSSRGSAAHTSKGWGATTTQGLASAELNTPPASGFWRKRKPTPRLCGGGLPPFGTVIINGYTFLNGKYLLDILYNNYLISGGLKLGYTISKLLDKGIIELIGPYGLTEGSYTASASINKLDTGVITTYALYITLGLISILFILFSPLFSPSLASLTQGGLALNTAGGLGLQAELLSTISLEQMQTNYTFSLKIVLLSIFSIYITAPSGK